MSKYCFKINIATNSSYHFLAFSFASLSLLLIYKRFFLLSLFRSVLAFLRKLDLELGFAFVGPFQSFLSYSPFFLKKFTLNTPNSDSISELPLPTRTSLLSFVLSYFSLVFNLTNRGHSCYCPSLEAWNLSWVRIATLSLLEWALAN